MNNLSVLTAQAQKPKKLTVVLLTYNRLNLLKEAVDSCRNQTDKNFELIIVDNNSNDGTYEYLMGIQHVLPQVKIITNQKNIGFRNSILIAFEEVKTEWVTILCDDDMLCKNFVHTFHEKNKCYPNSTCIVFSNVLIDSAGKEIKSHINPDMLIEPEFFLWSINNPKFSISSAGISNFCFLFDRDYFSKNNLIRDYPDGFFIDTFLFNLTSLKGGLISSSEITYKQRVWSGQTSSFSNSRLINQFIAFLNYDEDMRLFLSDKYFNGKKYILAVRSYNWFVKFYLFRIFTQGYLSPKICSSYVRAAYILNRKYLFHSFLVLLMFPFALKSSISVRRRLNELRKIISKN